MSHRCLQIWVRRAHEWEDRAVHVGAMHDAMHAPCTVRLASVLGTAHPLQGSPPCHLKCKSFFEVVGRRTVLLLLLRFCLPHHHCTNLQLQCSNESEALIAVRVFLCDMLDHRKPGWLSSRLLHMPIDRRTSPPCDGVQNCC